MDIQNINVDLKDKEDVLRFAVSSGIINTEEIKTVVDDMTRKEILEQHQYTLSQGKDGRWSTRILQEDGKYIIRHRKTKEELEDCLIEYYRQQQESIYLSDVYWKWMNEKLEYGEIQRQSYDRYNTDFERFFKKSEAICSKKFKNITEDDLEHFIKATIRDLHLTRKTYSSLVTLLNGIFKYGKKYGYTTISISSFIKDLYLPNNIFTKKYKDKTKEIFAEDEIPVITSYLRENPDIFNLALLLQFETGARIGEIATLKKSDIQSDYICIRRTEIKVKENDKWTVKVSELTKTDAGYREIIIPDSAKQTLSSILELNPTGEYLFMSDGKRIRENTYNKRLSLVCQKLGIAHRTTHKIRKTYGTTLLDSDVNDSFVAEQMGHTDVTTTRKLYYYSNKKHQTKVNQIRNAISF